MNIQPFLLAAIAATGTKAWAADSHRHHDAHIHGHAELTLAISGDSMQLELESPTMNLVGFEHRPNSGKDRQRLRDTADFLGQPARWLQLASDAGCNLAQAEVESDLLDDHGHNHGHHHDHGEHDKETHSDFRVTVEYRCTDTDALERIELSGLFQRFPGFERIEVQWLTDRQQSATELDPGNTVINLR